MAAWVRALGQDDHRDRPSTAGNAWHRTEYGARTTQAPPCACAGKAYVTWRAQTNAEATRFWKLACAHDRHLDDWAHF